MTVPGADGDGYELIGSDAAEQMTEVSVRAVWDTGGENMPECVSAALLGDGAVVADAVLSPENGWTHTWTSLPGGHSYTVVEMNVPEGYFAAYSTEGGEVTVCNVRNTAVVREKPGADEAG